MRAVASLLAALVTGPAGAADLDITGSPAAPARVRFLDAADAEQHAVLEGSEGWLNASVRVAAHDFVTFNGVSVNALGRRLQDGDSIASLHAIIASQQATITSQQAIIESQLATSNSQTGLPSLVWFNSSEHCNINQMRAFGWEVSLDYAGCDDGYFHFWGFSSFTQTSNPRLRGTYIDTGYIAIPLPANYTRVTVEYGQSCFNPVGTGAFVSLFLGSEELDHIHHSCTPASSLPYVNTPPGCHVFPPPNTCIHTFTADYTGSPTLRLMEWGTSIGYIRTVVLS